MFDTTDISNIALGIITIRMIKSYAEDMKQQEDAQKKVSKQEGERVKLAQNKVKLVKARDDMEKLTIDRENRNIENTAKEIKAQDKLRDAIEQVKRNE